MIINRWPRRHCAMSSDRMDLLSQPYECSILCFVISVHVSIWLVKDDLYKRVLKNNNLIPKLYYLVNVKCSYWSSLNKIWFIDLNESSNEDLFYKFRVCLRFSFIVLQINCMYLGKLHPLNLKLDKLSNWAGKQEDEGITQCSCSEWWILVSCFKRDTIVTKSVPFRSWRFAWDCLLMFYWCGRLVERCTLESRLLNRTGWSWPEENKNHKCFCKLFYIQTPHAL